MEVKKMLKTNSKKVIEKVHKYCIDSWNDYAGEEGLPTAESFEIASVGILKKCINEKLCFEKEKRLDFLKHYYSNSFFAAFEDWCQGLPRSIDAYYYVRNAVDQLGDWLEETQEERERFSESEAEQKITYLLFRELTKNKDIRKMILEA